MSVVRLSISSLVSISLVTIDPQLQQQLDELGKVKYLVAPNLFHYLSLDRAEKLYSHAQIVAPSRLKEKLPNLEIDLTFTQDLVKLNGELKHCLLAVFQIFIPPQI